MVVEQATEQPQQEWDTVEWDHAAQSAAGALGLEFDSELGMFFAGAMPNFQ